MSTSAAILHADLDAFFASVEQRDDPQLRGQPVIVGGGVVMAASYEARARGVAGGMGARRVRELCPQAVFVTPRMRAYTEASRAVRRIFRETSPRVEPISIDEAFLDVAGLEHISGTPPQIAARLRRTVRDLVGLPITVGVANTKHLAKVASAAAKPDGLLVIERGRELAFLHALPVEAIWGAGPATVSRLHEHGVRTVGEIAALGETALVSILGRAAGRHLYSLALNRDPRPVRNARPRRSIGSQSALGSSPKSAESIDASLVGVVDRVTRRLRAAGCVGRTVVLRLRFGDYRRATRSRTLPYATARTATVLAVARALISAATPLIERRGLTLVGLAITNLEDGGAVQLELSVDESRRVGVDAAVDAVRERFGSGAITRAVLLRQPRRHSLLDALE